MNSASPYALSLLGLTLCGIVMIASWAWARSHAFYSVVDAVWAFGIGGLAAFYFVLGDQPWALEKMVALALVLVWSIRLGSHLAKRLILHFPKEDRRYDQLRTQWKDRLASSSFIFFLFQAVTQSFFAFPFASLASASEISSFFWGGAVVSALGLVGESVADAQLKAFLADPAKQGRVCDRGLWRYSRHPNYFFEWIVWCGFGVMGSAASGGWLSLACPCLMLALLLFVTGVPPAEASSLRSKGQLYREYQESTSKFIPWFPRSRVNRPQEANVA